jgi:hypothetical protein
VTWLGGGSSECDCAEGGDEEGGELELHFEVGLS